MCCTAQFAVAQACLPGNISSAACVTYCTRAPVRETYGWHQHLPLLGHCVGGRNRWLSAQIWCGCHACVCASSGIAEADGRKVHAGTGNHGEGTAGARHTQQARLQPLHLHAIAVTMHAVQRSTPAGKRWMPGPVISHSGRQVTQGAACCLLLLLSWQVWSSSGAPSGRSIMAAWSVPCLAEPCLSLGQACLLLLSGCASVSVPCCCSSMSSALGLKFHVLALVRIWTARSMASQQKLAIAATRTHLRRVVAVLRLASRPGRW
ncbi:hypothetical protein COO60DRAFT_450991 [Scenedesmus sp. NREL 46B-D3]|nr:hypothetical protein COO60DRAFT_450991 [Scenedesmus sp. NREL 46B-D3]